MAKQPARRAERTGRTAPFAHLTSMPPARAADPKDDKKDEDEEARKQRADESDEDYAKRIKALDDKEKEDDDPDEKHAANDPDCPESKEDEDGEKEAVARGITAERGRWSAVLRDEAAGGRVELACTLLSETDMDAASITKTLKAVPVSSGSGLARRMADAAAVIPTPATGAASDGGPTSAKSVADAAIRAADKARGANRSAAAQ